MPAPNCQSLEVRHRLGRQGAAVEERHDAEIAAERVQPDARLEREFGQAAAADRIAVGVARARAAGSRSRAPTRRRRHRSAATGRCRRGRRRRWCRGGCARPRRRGPTPADRRWRRSGRAHSRRCRHGSSSFRADPAAEAEARGRVEQAVAAVIGEARRQRGDEEGPPSPLAGRPRSCRARRWR